MKNWSIPVAAGIVMLFVAFSAAFKIDQAEQAILVQFGEPIGDVIDEPGLHWRVPFIQEVRRFDKRLLAWDGDVSQIPTLGREFIVVDTTARWRISEPLQFLRAVRDEAGARTRLDDILDSVVRDIVSGTDRHRSGGEARRIEAEIAGDDNRAGHGDLTGHQLALLGQVGHEIIFEQVMGNRR
jgi:membrane protease subunit HflC